MTQLDITSDQYGLVTVLYTVSASRDLPIQTPRSNQNALGALHHCRDSLQPASEKVHAVKMAVQDYVLMVSLTSQRKPISFTLKSGALTFFGRGIVTACTAAVTNLSGLYACRFFLGLVSYCISANHCRLSVYGCP